MPETRIRSRKPGVGKRRGSGRPAAWEVASRMESLLDVATAIFLEHGYEHTSVSEIARRAGASKGTIYSRYPSKAELFTAVATRKASTIQASYPETFVSQAPLKKVLERFGADLLQRVTSPEVCSLHEIFIAALHKFPKLSSNFWDAGPQRTMTMLRDYLACHPEFKGKHPEHAAEMFWCLCLGQLTLRALLREKEKLTEEAIRFRVKEATRIFLSAYT